MRPFEHYLEAERLLEEADYNTLSDGRNEYLLRKAQVHAELAQVVEGRPKIPIDILLEG